MDWYNKNYDTFIDKICPDYNKALGYLAYRMPYTEYLASVIELGCGTGNFTELMARRLSYTHLVAYDNDSSQLEKAAEKLKDYSNITLINTDVINAEIPEDSTIVSSLLFHLLEPEKRKILFQNLCDSKVKEVYVFDRLKGESQEEEKKYQEHFRANLIRNKLPDGLVETLVKENRETNDPDKLSEQKEFFEQRKYSLDIVYRNPNHGFMVYQIKKQNPK